MKEVFDFLKKLKKNNSKEWFDVHRAEYESAKKQVIALVETIIPLVEKIDPAVQNLQAKDCMFRINRDVRFSKNKDPYKTNMGIVFAPGGKGARFRPGAEPGGVMAPRSPAVFLECLDSVRYFIIGRFY